MHDTGRDMFGIYCHLRNQYIHSTMSGGAGGWSFAFRRYGKRKGGISLDASYKGGGFGRSAINEGVGVVLITCSARPMKIGGDPKEEWLLPEVKSSHTFLCMILLLPKLLRYRSFILNLFGSSDQLVVFYYFSSRKSFLLSPFLSILKFHLFFSSKIWI